MKELLFLTIVAVALSSRFIYGAPPLPQDKYPGLVTDIVPPAQNMQEIYEYGECEETNNDILLAWRMEDCTYASCTDDLSCAVSNEAPHKTEIDFRASAPTTSLGFQYFLHEKNGYEEVEPLVDEVITSDPINAGMNYTFHRSARVPDEFQGKMVTAKVILLDDAGDSGIIMCATADFFIYA